MVRNSERIAWEVNSVEIKNKGSFSVVLKQQTPLSKSNQLLCLNRQTNEIKAAVFMAY